MFYVHRNGKNNTIPIHRTHGKCNTNNYSFASGYIFLSPEWNGEKMEFEMRIDLIVGLIWSDCSVSFEYYNRFLLSSVLCYYCCFCLCSDEWDLQRLWLFRWAETGWAWLYVIRATTTTTKKKWATMMTMISVSLHTTTFSRVHKELEALKPLWN